MMAAMNETRCDRGNEQMNRTIKRAATAAVAFAGLAINAAGPALAGTQNFSDPMYNGNRLDWCQNWAQGCGKAAADAWCQWRGFSNATNFSIDEDIGGSSPTRVIGTGALCDQGFCDGFSHIQCWKPDPTPITHNNPMWNGYRLDWCQNWAQGCGEGAADAYCSAIGEGDAISWTIAPDIGASTPTRVIGSGAVCDQGFCDGFAQITCQGS
jgi:hypothetical protein